MAKKLMRECEYCGQTKPTASFLKTKNNFFPSGTISICTDCIEDFIEDNNGNLNFMDKLCRWLDIPFLPDKWLKLYEINGKIAISTYLEQTQQEYYPMVDWAQVNKDYLELKEKGTLQTTIAALSEEERKRLYKKWGEEYSDTDIDYLEDLYLGILQTQNINGKLQTDDAIKLCKISLMIDKRIRDGDEFDKLLKSYDTLRKGADFTPKNIKNACDFDSVGELFAYCEKRGWENIFYDDVPRDTVDLVMKDIQSWLRNLYKNETGIAEDVERRINALKAADELEETIMAIEDDGLDDFTTEGYDVEDFDAEASI